MALKVAFSGGPTTPAVTPTQQTALSTISSTVNYLHPVLQKFLQTIPSTVISSHPALIALASTHPTTVGTSGVANPATSSILSQILSLAKAPSASGLAALTTPGSSQTILAPPRNPTADALAMGGGAPASQVTPDALANYANAPKGPSGLYPNGTPIATSPPAPIGSPQPAGAPPTPGIPNPGMAASPNQPPPVSAQGAPPPIGNSAAPPPPGGTPPGSPGDTIQWGSLNGNSYSPGSGVKPGPFAMNHVPYGPELTGLSGYGGLITPNGTPVAMSNWQRLQLDPTSIARYNSYVSDIAGMNPADMAQIGASETGNKMADLKAPIRFSGVNVTPAPAGG
jgi:hypothetical protein